MNKPFAYALCAAVLLGAGVAAASPRLPRAVEDAAESAFLDINLSSATQGQILARLCDRCELLTLEVDASTIVLLDGARKTLETAVERKDRGATVIFDHDTRIVKRIVLWD
jgi:hypothetical protein